MLVVNITGSAEKRAGKALVQALTSNNLFNLGTGSDVANPAAAFSVFHCSRMLFNSANASSAAILQYYLHAFTVISVSCFTKRKEVEKYFVNKVKSLMIFGPTQCLLLRFYEECSVIHNL